MAIDRNRALKLEDGDGGSSVDLTPTETAPNSDGLDARAYYLQNGASDDASAYVSRVAGGADLTLTDAVAGTKRTQDLVSRVAGAVGAHQSLPDLAHFVGAPADGWATPYLTVASSGPLVVTRTWWTSSAQIRAIFRQEFTYNGPLIATVVSTAFDAAGAQVKKLTDVYVYNGPILTGIARSAT